MDNNIILLSKDYEVFKKVINKMHHSIEEFKEINSDALLGKKKVSCLSCSKGKDGYEAINNIVGQDGKLY